MGGPDRHGNYVLEVGPSPAVAFMAHHDTVHSKAGYQPVTVDEFGYARAEGGECLGADCATGVWLILGRIRAGVPGVYVVHADEEAGCRGAAALAGDGSLWLRRIGAAISLDRYGERSIVTHQLGRRTASDAFAGSLAAVLGMPVLKPDPDGVYADSNAYSHIVPECTNLSVGYYDQHGPKERQNLGFARRLREALIGADWGRLTIHRDPSSARDVFPGDIGEGCGWFDDPMEDLVARYPAQAAGLRYRMAGYRDGVA